MFFTITGDHHPQDKDRYNELSQESGISKIVGFTAPYHEMLLIPRMS